MKSRRLKRPVKEDKDIVRGKDAKEAEKTCKRRQRYSQSEMEKGRKTRQDYVWTLELGKSRAKPNFH